MTVARSGWNVLVHVLERHGFSHSAFSDKDKSLISSVSRKGKLRTGKSETLSKMIERADALKKNKTKSNQLVLASY